MSRFPKVLALAGLAATACHPPDAGRPDFEALAFLQVVAAEDARPAGGRGLETLLRGTASPLPTLRAVAGRALGRLENPDLIELIAPLLDDEEPMVRRAAADAVAQAVHRGFGTPTLALLLAAVGREHDAEVLGALARSLGRLRLDPDERTSVARALVALSRGPEGDAPPYQMEGVVLGMASFVQRLRGDPRPAFFQTRLRELTRYGVGAPAGDVGAVRVRELAVAAYGSEGLTADELGAFLSDPAAEVRRAAATRLASIPDPFRSSLADVALADRSARVRLEAVRRGLGAATLTAQACARLLTTAERDPDTPVRLAALDILALPCPDRGGQSVRLESLVAAAAAAPPSDWHVGGHALAALAGVDPRRARPLIPAWTPHPNLFARTWAATAAARAGDAEILRSLAADAHPNVGTEALRGLAGLLGRGADADLVAALRTSDDNQLLLTVAGLLEGTGERAAATEAALGALDRISEARWETLRDARVALLTLVEAAGDSTRVPRVEPFLRDYDPAVALRAAEVLRAWTGKRWIDAPRGSPRLPLPTPDEIRAMEGATVVLHMARGGTVEIRLFPWQAPTNAVRFYRLAGAGGLEGLTFHRMAPNFVIQGGSPGANEYAGHGAFTRDEVGLAPNWRGTVGLSTRGRDTGDGQMYVNLVDNVRLDHDYTILGRVTAGMDVVDAVLEGDVIERVEVREGR